MNQSGDRIERQILIRAPRAKVWQALANAEEFGRWFRVGLDGKSFVPGQYVQGHIMHPGYEHVVWNVLVERVVPESVFSFRWHPYAIDPQVDYSHEPTTLVEFTLHDAEDGTLLTLVESGFDAIPEARRAEAIRMNSRGWDAQMQNIEAHVTAH